MKAWWTILALLLGGLPATAAPLDLRLITTSVQFDQYESDTIIVSTSERQLFYKTRGGGIMAYPVGVAKNVQFEFVGEYTVSRMREWPDWHPPKEMIDRVLREEGRILPTRMPGGHGNPLGSRALYIFEGTRDTLYRIHGTIEAWTIGQAVSSGCIRMHNADVEVLYQLVSIGTKVVVLP